MIRAYIEYALLSFKTKGMKGGIHLSAEVILEMKDIVKTFPGVKALDSVHLRVTKGTVHGLMGENGAGKSTLMKVLMGIYKPDSGKITFKGKPLKVHGTADALRAGISMIHQELSPIPHMTVAENIFLGREPNKFGFTNEKELVNMTQKLLDDLELTINPKTKMKDLSTAYIQMVEIAKAISYNSDLVIMDEPTSAITDKEVAQLFKMIRRLKERETAIIYITHKMDEVFAITDDCTVLRDGQFIGTAPSKELTDEKLISMMVGREVDQIFPKIVFDSFGEKILEVKNFSDGKKFKDVNFYVRKGEILGFAGLMGSGRSEIMETLFGVRKKAAGQIFINGKETTIKSPSDAIRQGIGFLTEDRKGTGCFLPLSVADNIVMSDLKNYIGPTGLMNQKLVKKNCEDQRVKLNIKTPSIEQTINNLSGGNQQKVVVARWLLMDPDILIIDEPTRGIDVGAKSEIHKLMTEMVKNGKAVIMISSEMPEVIGMSDRIMVMHEGRITGEVMREEATQELIMEYATE